MYVTHKYLFVCVCLNSLHFKISTSLTVWIFGCGLYTSIDKNVPKILRYTGKWVESVYFV